MGNLDDKTVEVAAIRGGVEVLGKGSFWEEGEGIPDSLASRRALSFSACCTSCHIFGSEWGARQDASIVSVCIQLALVS